MRDWAYTVSMIRVFTSKTQATGEKGEEASAAFLEKAGYRIVERNANNKYGEIDIVAKFRNTHYFFEVKAGKSGGFINPAENLTKAKLRKFLISVEHYALVHGIRDYRAQGIIVLLPQKPDGEAKVEIMDLY